MSGFDLEDGERTLASQDLKRKAFIIVSFIIFFTLIAATSTVTLAPPLAASGLLAYTFGLRHGVDADHIAAIDNVTRRLTVQGKRPATVGLFFALGHSSVVMLMCCLVVVASDYMRHHLQNFARVGGILGASISGSFLLVLGILNLLMSRQLWQSWREGTKYGGHDHPVVGLFARFCPGTFEGITKPYQMYFVGFLFGLGFDTSSEVGLLGIVAVSRGDVARPLVLLLPALFMAGMCLVDTLNGVLMAWAYGKALEDSMQRLYYNLFLTTTSGVVAVVVGSVELLGVLQAATDFHGSFWQDIAAVNDNFEELGVAVVAFFLLSMLVALGCFPRVFPQGKPWEEPAKKHLLRYVQEGNLIDRSGV
eukprot:CAMPEP_0206488336 /NCGR_PEP_ID=MMETSP0324_2-20121206/42338_1 /ASSEMBLY_ACC=CAM_ASM_000836 /TAXON_ID=2866 /ORGANISM="Crypthecodinium cohnii, Strain Seligo" /LENGTH=363 /DNA_ID=CAMNT_0053967313 /DNA_START=15 /DNA_END=1106 /DNA_ORIENTATION=+